MKKHNFGITKRVSDKIYDHLKKEIQSGVYRSGEKIPSENELVEMLGVSRNSLREALTTLEHEGYLVRKRGIGTFVIEEKVDRVNAAIDKLYSTSKLIASQGKSPGTVDLTTSLIKANEIISAKLKIPFGSDVALIERKRTADGKPFCWDESYFIAHPSLKNQAEMRKSESLMEYVEKNMDVRIDHAIANLKPAICDEKISKKLKIPINTLMYMVEQVHYVNDKKPIWFSRVWYPEEAITVNVLVTW